MDKVRFDMLKELIQYFDYIFVQTDSDNFYIFNQVMGFKIPIQYKKDVLSDFGEINMELENFILEMCEHDEEMRKYTDREETIIQRDYKGSSDYKRFFENTDFITANITKVVGINEKALYMEHINPFLNIMSNLSEITYLFETEDGLLEVDSKYCDFVIDFLQLFSDEKVKKFVNKKNNYLYIENDILKAVIAPMKTSEERKRLFVKKFLVWMEIEGRGNIGRKKDKKMFFKI